MNIEGIRTLAQLYRDRIAGPEFTWTSLDDGYCAGVAAFPLVYGRPFDVVCDSAYGALQDYLKPNQPYENRQVINLFYLRDREGSAVVAAFIKLTHKERCETVAAALDRFADTGEFYYETAE